MPRRSGFTLVELTVTTGIIGLLAAIAVSNFMEMQHDAKVAEAPTNVDGLITAQWAYSSIRDEFIEATEQPRAVSALDKKAVPWRLLL